MEYDIILFIQNQMQWIMVHFIWRIPTLLQSQNICIDFCLGSWKAPVGAVLGILGAAAIGVGGFFFLKKTGRL